MSKYPDEKLRTIYTVVKWGDEDRNRWTRIGTGFVNRDGSITIKLDGLPVNGELIVRDFQRREERPRSGEEGGRFDHLPMHLTNGRRIEAEQA